MKTMILLAAMAVSAVTAYAALSTDSRLAPYCSCCTSCICENCLCEALGCQCDTGGSCACDDACCQSGDCCEASGASNCCMK